MQTTLTTGAVAVVAAVLIAGSPAPSAAPTGVTWAPAPPGPAAPMPLPARTLTIGDLFPHETVVFPFDHLSQTAREGLPACFASSAR